MSTDVYAPCLCGSGKKLKFCCNAIISEMARINKLKQNHQTIQALQLLEDLEQKHPGNAWILTTKATAFLDDGKILEAKKILEELLESNPDHLLALTLSAVVSLSADGFEASKPVIHRTFQLCAVLFPDIISDMAFGIATSLFSRQKFMAARQHLAIAMRFAPEKNRQEVFLQLLKFDGDSEIPYPLRGVHALAKFTPDDEEQLKEAEKGVRLSNLGCWALSARIFAKLTVTNPDDAALWQNVGLCHAWDGHEDEAAKAFHKAAERHQDYETAVECETLAQLLDLGTTQDVIKVKSLQYNVESVGKLLTTLDEQDRLVRVQISPNEKQKDEETIQPAAIYNLLDRSIPVDGSKEEFTFETVPNVLAEISVFDHNPLEEEPARVFIIGFEGENLQQSQAVLEQAAGEQMTSPEDEEKREQVLETLPRDLFPLHWRWFFPAKMSLQLRKRLEKQKWDHLVQDVWPNIPLSGLQGKTPLEASADPDLKVRLAAVLMVLDTYADRIEKVLDASLLYERLEIAAPTQLELTPQTSGNALSAMQTHRLSIADLTDEQLAGTLNRALLIHHSNFLYKVLTEILKRPTCAEKIDCDRAYFTLADLCRERCLNEEALQWVAKGRELAESRENAFEDVLKWKMREMAFRLDDPDDPKLTSLLKHIWDYYGPKVPQLRTSLASIAKTYTLKGPWDDETSIVTPQTASEAPAQEGIWTPDAQSGPVSKEGVKKLWLPGQD